MKPRVLYSSIARPTIGQLIERAIAESELPGARKFGSSKTYTLGLVKRSPLGALVAVELKAMDLVAHCRTRRGAGIHPATITHDVDGLRVVLKTAADLWEIPGIEDALAALAKAKRTLEKEQLIGKSVPRDRRPTPDEMERIKVAALERMKHKRTKIPLPVIFEFAYTSGRRISEVCRLRWGDVNAEKRTCIVRDLKNPKGKGYHGEFPLLGRAWEIVMAQPRMTNDLAERIFPYMPKSCGAAFRVVCKKLGILNLRLHDQRRECFSRLFEDGFGVPEVAKVSLHLNPSILLRTYTALRPEDLHLGPASKRQSATV